MIEIGLFATSSSWKSSVDGEGPSQSCFPSPSRVQVGKEELPTITQPAAE